MNRFGSAILVAAFLIGGTAFAGSSPDVPSGPKTSTRTLNITGVGVNDITDVDGTTGACNVDPWVDHCSGTNCSCIQITVSKASGNMDKGAQTVTSFFVTVNNNVNPATEPAVGSGPSNGCNPILGILTDTSSTDAKTINLFGVSCGKVIAVTPGNPQGKHVSDTLVGGWGISGSTTPSPDASGWGTLSGSVMSEQSSRPNAISVKLSGLVTE